MSRWPFLAVTAGLGEPPGDWGVAVAPSGDIDSSDRPIWKHSTELTLLLVAAIVAY